MENRTLEGHWWRPGQEDQKTAGIATFEGSDLRLRLLGAWMKPSTRGQSYRPVNRVPMIYGSCEGKLVTMLGARTSNFTLKFGADSDRRQTFNVDMMLVGIWLDGPDESCFESVTLGVDNLHEWAARSGALDEVTQREQGGTRFATSWESTDSITAQIGDAEVSLGLTGSTRRRTLTAGTESIIAERAWFGVTPAQPASARNMVDRWAGPLQDLVSFAMDAPCALGDVDLHWTPPAAAAPQGADHATPNNVQPAKVQVYFRALFPSQPDAKPVYGHDALFRASDLPLEILLPAWFAAVERFGPVVGMLLGLRYGASTYVENRVITAVAAAEGLHRRLLPAESYVPDADFAELKARVAAAIPAEHREWVKARLRNEPSLKERLEQLVAHLPAGVTTPFLPGGNRWARRTTDTRDWLAHRFEMKNPPDGGEMYVLSRLTSSVLALVLMHELGLDEAHLTRVATDQKSFDWLTSDGRRLAPRVFPDPQA